jgi:hypothetical protein
MAEYADGVVLCPEVEEEERTVGMLSTTQLSHRPFVALQRPRQPRG